MRIAGFQVILFIVLLAATAANQASCFAQSPRAARSVHLWYKAPQAVEFYNEVKVEQSTDGSYFMVCGFHHEGDSVFRVGPRPAGRSQQRGVASPR